MRTVRWIGTAAWFLLGAWNGEAQELTPARGQILGRVIDVETGAGLEGAAVMLEPRPSGAFGARSDLGSYRAAVLGTSTDADGAYLFDRLGSGAYQIRVQRIGYHPASVDVELHGAASSRVTLGLEVVPIELEPLAVSVDEGPILQPTIVVDSQADRARARSEERRRTRFLESDVQGLTYGEILEAVTLGESDIFRALQRLPGVSTRDDFGSELWVRGASWGQTRVYFDGLPLYNPVHMGGFVSAIPPEAVGSVFFHPGVRPVSLGEGAAGVVDLTSRPARPNAGIPTMGELSFLSGRLLAEGRFADDRGGLLLAGRRSWWDLATTAVSDHADGRDEIVDYAISSLSAHFDYTLGDETSVEYSRLAEKDRLKGELPGAITGSLGSWGNVAERLTLATTLFGRPASFTVGRTNYEAEVENVPDWFDVGPGPPDRDRVRLDPASTLVTYEVARAEVSDVSEGGAPPTWLVGGELVKQTLRQRGGVLPDGLGVLSAPFEADLRQTAAWGQLTTPLGDRLTLQAGLRWEGGDPIKGGGTDRLAPRISARWTFTPRLSLSAGLARSFQYNQGVAGGGTAFGPQLHITQFFVLADERTPALKADIGTIGAEYWVGRSWIAAANAYLRNATDVAVLDPTPGLRPDWPDAPKVDPWVPGENRALGLELSVRRLTGRMTGSASYSLSRSKIEADGLSYFSPADRRHVANVTGLARATPTILIGLAYTGASGAPFTRTFRRYCHDWPVDGQCPAPATGPTRFQEAPNAERGPSYHSLDLLFDWTRPKDTWSWGLRVTVRNVLGVNNRGVYDETICLEDSYVGGGCSSRHLTRDEFEDGISFPVPFIAFRVVF